MGPPRRRASRDVTGPARRRHHLRRRASSKRSVLVDCRPDGSADRAIFYGGSSSPSPRSGGRHGRGALGTRRVHRLDDRGARWTTGGGLVRGGGGARGVRAGRAAERLAHGASASATSSLVSLVDHRVGAGRDEPRPRDLAAHPPVRAGLGLGTGLVASVLGVTVATRWFVRRRGLVLGLLGATQRRTAPVRPAADGAGGGRSAGAPARCCWPPSRSSWRPVLLLSATTRPSRRRPLRRRPSVAHPPIPGPSAGSCGGRRARRDFWLLAGTFFVCGATSNGLVGQHFIPHAVDHGFTPMAAAGALAVMGGINFIGTVASGWLTDRLDPRRLLSIFYSFRGVAGVPAVRRRSARPAPSRSSSASTTSRRCRRPSRSRRPVRPAQRRPRLRLGLRRAHDRGGDRGLGRRRSCATASATTRRRSWPPAGSRSSPGSRPWASAAPGERQRPRPRPRREPAAHAEEGKATCQGETLGGMLAGFEQQIFRTTPPPHELVPKGTPLRGLSGEDAADLDDRLPGRAGDDDRRGRGGPDDDRRRGRAPGVTRAARAGDGLVGDEASALASCGSSRSRPEPGSVERRSSGDSGVEPSGSSTGTSGAMPSCQMRGPSGSATRRSRPAGPSHRDSSNSPRTVPVPNVVSPMIVARPASCSAPDTISALLAVLPSTRTTSGRSVATPPGDTSCTVSPPWAFRSR